jgi:hypothetical protein
VRLAEIDRRQNHISQVDPNHPLLPIALDCLKDKDTERPSAQQLCERVTSLKERPEYSDSVAAAQQERQQLQQLQQIHREQTQQIVRENERVVVQLRQQLQESQQLNQMNQEAMTEKERELGQQVESRERERAKFEKQLLEKDKQIHELEGQLLLRSKDKNHREAARKVKLAWREGKKAPFAYGRFCDAVVDGSKVYFRGGGDQLFTYNIVVGCNSQTTHFLVPASQFSMVNQQLLVENHLLTN